MSRGVNKAIIVGTLGQTPELRYTAGGTSVTEISVATNERYKTEERTEWHRITLWGKLAEIANQYLQKGSQVYIEGSIQTEKWQDKDGKDRYTTKIIGREMQMLGSPRNDNDHSDRPQRSSRVTPPAGQQPPPAIDDDDLPF